MAKAEAAVNGELAIDGSCSKAQNRAPKKCEVGGKRSLEEGYFMGKRRRLRKLQSMAS